jgi:hypothetical protein
VEVPSSGAPNPRCRRHRQSLPRQEGWLGQVTVLIWQPETLLGSLGWRARGIRSCMAQVRCRVRVDRMALAAHMAVSMVGNRLANGIQGYGVGRRRPCGVGEVLFGGPSGLIGTLVSTTGRTGSTVTNSPIGGLLYGEMVDPLQGEVVVDRSGEVVVAVRKGPLMVAVRTELLVVTLRSDKAVLLAHTGLTVGILVVLEHRLGRSVVARGRLVIDARRLNGCFAA